MKPIENKKTWTKNDLNPLGKWLRFCHECDCGSEEICQYHKEKKFKYCSKCKERKFLKN